LNYDTEPPPVARGDVVSTPRFRRPSWPGARFSTYPTRLRFSLVGKETDSGTVYLEPPAYAWEYFSGISLTGGDEKDAGERWIVFADANESIETRPLWSAKIAGQAGALLVATRGNGSLSWTDPPPYYIERSLPLLGWTADACRLQDAV